MPARALPTVARADHAVAFSAPFYTSGVRGNHGGLCLHRYLDTEFIPRFLGDLGAGRLTDPITEPWWQADRFSQHGGELVLRLPIHRTFYLVACELVCDRPLRPALDPARIRSAGFVIRARSDDGRWMLEAGEPLGWQTAAAPTDADADPDPRRRLAARRVAAGRLAAGTSNAAGGAYTGEETHPLHPVLVTDTDGKPHTILYGFLPLGGQSLARDNPFTAADEAVAVAADRALLAWPFGHRGRADLTWRAADATLVEDGRPTGACFELLELLVNRYHVGEPATGAIDPLNADLAGAAARLRFVEQVAAPPGGFGAPGAGPTQAARFTLLDYLAASFAVGPDNPLAAWLAARRHALDAAGAPPGTAPGARLPRRPVNGAGELAGYRLTISRAEAEEWRLLLGQRLLDQVRRTGAELPLPKFRQTPDALYQVIPFVRALDDAGCERLTWADAAVRSTAFRVAAPFDPDASRPTLIQMPGLADLKRGLAKGAAMLVPPDTARLLAALNIDKGAAPGVATAPPPPGAGLGVQMICSFSLPIITLVAMILLMIMVTILNLLFFWLPWVKICLPFPKLK